MSSAIYLRSSPSRFSRFPAEEYTSISNLSLPLRFDWRDKHVVTKVRNQKTVCLRFFFLFNHFRMGVTFGVKFSQTWNGTILSVGKFTPRLSQNKENGRPPPLEGGGTVRPSFTQGMRSGVSLSACPAPTQTPRTLQNSGWKAEGGNMTKLSSSKGKQLEIRRLVPQCPLNPWAHPLSSIRDPAPSPTPEESHTFYLWSLKKLSDLL